VQHAEQINPKTSTSKRLNVHKVFTNNSSVVPVTILQFGGIRSCTENEISTYSLEDKRYFLCELCEKHCELSG